MFVSMLAAGKFYEFLDNSMHPEAELDFEYYDHLADYVYKWLARGHGAIACSNDHGIFMMAMVFITNHWAEDPGRISCLLSDTKEISHFGPSPTKVLDMHCHTCQLAFDPRFFTQMAHDPEYYNRIHSEADGLCRDKG